jgi:hypothetical protein
MLEEHYIGFGAEIEEVLIYTAQLAVLWELSAGARDRLLQESDATSLILARGNAVLRSRVTNDTSASAAATAALGGATAATGGATAATGGAAAASGGATGANASLDPLKFWSAGRQTIGSTANDKRATLAAAAAAKIEIEIRRVVSLRAGAPASSVSSRATSSSAGAFGSSATIPGVTTESASEASSRDVSASGITAG